MKVELIGAIDFLKLAKFLDERVGEIIKDSDSLKEYLDLLSSDKTLNTDNSIKSIDKIIDYLENNSQGKNISLITKVLNTVCKKQRKDLVSEIRNIRENIVKGNVDAVADVKKLKCFIDEQISALETIRPDVVDYTEKLETERRAEIVSTAGKLSRFDGNIFDVLEIVSEGTLDENSKYANFVSGTLKHESITDHDYVVFALQDVSALIEQTLIIERFASFTIKSRRLVNFLTAGFFVPDFHDENGNIIKENEKAKAEFIEDMKYLFDKYDFFIKNGIDYEDARYSLPYCYHSNILMGVNTHVLKNMIIKFTKTKYAKIQEVRELGEKLYEIAKEKVPYIIPAIDAVEPNYEDEIGDFIRATRKDKYEYNNYKVLDSPKLIAKSNDVDETILISAIMRYTQLEYDVAKELYHEAINNDPNFKETLMRLVFFKGDQTELAQVSFEFQIGISLAVLTHYTRHRTHPIIVPDLFPLVDLYQFMTPPAIKNNEELNDKYVDMFTMNEINCKHMNFKYGIRYEDLVYYTLAGNMVNIVTRFDGKTFAHIAELRECNRTQWESRMIALKCHNELKKSEDSKLYSKFVGPTCETKGVCNEGKECCGKIRQLKKEQDDKKLA